MNHTCSRTPSGSCNTPHECEQAERCMLPEAKSNVVPLVVINNADQPVNDVPAENVLRAALEAGMRDVVILGRTQDGSEYLATSFRGGKDVLWLMHRLQHRLMEEVKP